jgi:hypothetical protein
LCPDEEQPLTQVKGFLKKEIGSKNASLGKLQDDAKVAETALRRAAAAMLQKALSEPFVFRRLLQVTGRHVHTPLRFLMLS